MAIAGSAMPSCRVRIVNGRLVADSWETRHSDTLVHEPEDALAKLVETGAVFMRTTGPQWIQLQELWAGETES